MRQESKEKLLSGTFPFYPTVLIPFYPPAPPATGGGLHGVLLEGGGHPPLHGHGFVIAPVGGR